MRLFPRGLTGQLILVLVLTILATNVTVALLAYAERTATVDRLVRETLADRLDRAAGALAGFEPDAPRTAIRRTVRSMAGPRLFLWVTRAPAVRDGVTAAGALAALPAALPDWDVRVGAAPLRAPPRPAEGERPEPVATVSIDLRNGLWLNAQPRLAAVPPVRGRAIVVWLVSAALVALAAWLVVRRLVRPLRQLTEAADIVGRGGAAPAVPETGPEDIRAAARAFNTMAGRIGRFVDDRLAMLAALSHDLRTPISALRLRSEEVSDPVLRDRLITLIDGMAASAEASLSLARENARREDLRPLDLGALVEDVVTEFTDLGRPVAWHPPVERAVVEGRPGALTRAVRNLVANAVTYGTRATVTVERAADEIVVLVDDDGPGLADLDVEALFQPFVRGDAARGADGGSGLGLAVARAAARGHGGDVTLTSRPPGGTRARLTLPAPRPSATPAAGTA